jgi:hypothetical protein
MDKLDFKNMNNEDLLKIRREKIDEFERVRLDIIKIFNYWRKVESDYNLIHEECNKRKIL